MAKLTREEYWQINSQGIEKAEEWASQQNDPELLFSYRQIFDELLGELSEILDGELKIQTCMDGYDYWRFNIVAVKENFENRRHIINDLLMTDEEGNNWIDYRDQDWYESWCYVPLDRYMEITSQDMYSALYP